MNRIREVRKAKKLSQTELAEMLHVHQTAVSQWENGKTEPDMDNLCRIADIFGVTVDYLLGVDTQSKTIDEQLSEIDFALSGEIRDLNDEEKQHAQRAGAASARQRGHPRRQGRFPQALQGRRQGSRRRHRRAARGRLRALPRHAAQVGTPHGHPPSVRLLRQG